MNFQPYFLGAAREPQGSEDRRNRANARDPCTDRRPDLYLLLKWHSLPYRFLYGFSI